MDFTNCASRNNMDFTNCASRNKMDFTYNATGPTMMNIHPEFFIYKNQYHYPAEFRTLDTMIPPILPILVIPDTRLTSPYTILPKPNVIDDFLLLSGINAGCTEPTSIVGPIRMNDVKCVVQLNIKMASSAFTPLTESNAKIDTDSPGRLLRGSIPILPGDARRYSRSFWAPSRVPLQRSYHPWCF